MINYVDWRNTTYGGHRYDKVPDSCCVNEKHACGFEFEISKINRGVRFVIEIYVLKNFVLIACYFMV